MDPLIMLVDSHQYANLPTSLGDFKRSDKLGAELPLFSKPFTGDTLRNTQSPTSNSNGLSFDHQHNSSADFELYSCFP
jgi:hypothetical protein